jgi:hypothetical protein
MAVTKTRHITFEMKSYGWMRHMGVSRPTEMTIRDLLQEELRKRGVTVVPEFSVSTPMGLLKPDILLKNGAQYVVETKLGKLSLEKLIDVA